MTEAKRDCLQLVIGIDEDSVPTHLRPKRAAMPPQPHLDFIYTGLALLDHLERVSAPSDGSPLRHDTAIVPHYLLPSEAPGLDLNDMAVGVDRDHGPPLFAIVGKEGRHATEQHGIIVCILLDDRSPFNLVARVDFVVHRTKPDALLVRRGSIRGKGSRGEADANLATGGD